MQTLRNILSTPKALVLADQAVFSGGNFLTTLMLARVFDPFHFGLYSTVLVCAYLGVSLANAVVIQPLQVSFSGMANRQTYTLFSLGLQFAIVAILLGAAAIGLQLNLDCLAPFHQLTGSIVVFSAGFLLQDYFRKYFLATGLVARALAIDLLTTGLQVGVLATAFVAPLELKWLLILQGIAFFPAILWSMRQVKWGIIETKLAKSHLMLHFQQGKWLLLSALVQWWSGNLFLLASGVFLGLEALGALRLVQSLFGVLNMVLQTFENYALPQASRLMLQNPEDARVYLKNLGKKALLGFGTLALGLFIFADPLIKMAGGAAYAPYADVVRGMAVLYLLIFAGYPSRLAIRALILNKFVFWGYALSLAFGMLTFNYLLGHFQLLGAIAGLLLSQLCLLVFWQVILVKNNFLLWK